MCVIIYKPVEKYISDRRLREAHAANPDGCGIMWAAMGGLRFKRGLWDFSTFLREFNKCYRDYGDRDYIIHFRTASASDIGLEYCHPFFVNPGLAFMQNGNLYEFTDYFPGREKDGNSDVQRFNEEILQRTPNCLDENFRQILERYASECLSKFVFLDNQGGIEIINESAGEWRKGIWYSNGGIENYIGYGYSGAYYYNPGDIRHKGGLMNVEMLGEHKRKWSQCEICQGWFGKSKLNNNKCSRCLTYTNLCQKIAK